ncbi:MAG: hypothetical protein LDL24_00945 [Treponema sp.]|nr:hypothetical protein [Treponema sp.]
MKPWNKSALAASLLFCLSFVLSAQDIDFSIRYMDKRVYYAGQGPILIQLTITNKSASTYRFFLADERAFSVDFDVRTMTNRSLEPSEILIRKRTQNQRVFFREVLIQSGESFSFTEDLTDYVALNEAGSYVVQARLYPQLYQQKPNGTATGSVYGNSSGAFMSSIAGNPSRSMENPSVDSNRLALTLRPAPLAEPGKAAPVLDADTNALLVRQNLPPDQIISYILTARQKGQWEKFFLYLDLEAMLVRDSARKRQWQAESEEGRQRMLERYRSDLKNAMIDGDIATIPIEFTVERTNYGAEDGTVTVLEKFRYGTYVEKKRYTYYVRRKDGIWVVVDYSVVNLGTE